MNKYTWLGVGALGVAAVIAVSGAHDPAPTPDDAAVYLGSVKPPRMPVEHVYAAASPDGTIGYKNLAICGGDCFALHDQSADVTTRYLYNGKQWQTDSVLVRDAVICPGNKPVDAHVVWVTDDLEHFYSDIPEGAYCESMGIMKPDSLTFTLTPAY